LCGSTYVDSSHISLEQLELYRDITESRLELDDKQAYVNRAYGRQKEQQLTLDKLGLDELEALEYVLMLSRDEEHARSMQSPLVPKEDSVFDDDFGEESARGGVSSWSTQSPPSSPHRSNGRSIPRTSPSASNRKVQISPPFRPEPTKAGFSTGPFVMSATAYPPSGKFVARDIHTIPSPVSLDSFPQINSSTRVAGAPGTNFSHRSTSGSPEAPRSVWSSPTLSTPSSELPSPGTSPTFTSRRMTMPVWGAPNSATRSAPPTVSILSTHLTRHASTENVNVDAENVLSEDTDEGLRFAIQLSLAEARSRGHVV
jgi:hypothetical protein